MRISVLNIFTNKTRRTLYLIANFVLEFVFYAFMLFKYTDHDKATCLNEV